MKILEKRNWDFTLYEENNTIYLEVVCGSVGLYDVLIKLTPIEKAAWHSQGIGAILPLVEQVRLSPQKFSDRQIK